MTENHTDNQNEKPELTKVSNALFLGIFFFPPLALVTVLKKGYSQNAKVGSITWLVFFLIVASIGLVDADFSGEPLARHTVKKEKFGNDYKVFIYLHENITSLMKSDCEDLMDEYKSHSVSGQVSLHGYSEKLERLVPGEPKKNYFVPWAVLNFDGKGIQYDRDYCI